MVRPKKVTMEAIKRMMIRKIKPKITLMIRSLTSPTWIKAEMGLEKIPIETPKII